MGVSVHLMSEIRAVLRRWRCWWTSDVPETEMNPALTRVREAAVAVVTSPAVRTGIPALVVLASAAMQLAQGNGPVADHMLAGGVLSGLLAAALLGRRAYPLTTFGVCALIALVQWAMDIRLVADVALLVAVYTVASLYPARTAWACAAVLELGSVLAVWRWQPSGMLAENLVLLSAPTVAAVCAGIAVRGRRAALAAAVERAERMERERHQQDLLAQAAERARIAREMHDVLAHGLSVMVTLTEGALAKQATDPERARTAMTLVSAAGREALADVRELLGVLRVDVDQPRRPQPGIGDIGRLVAQVSDAGITVTTAIDEIGPQVSTGVSLAAYRIVQESLTNVLKHAVAPRTVRVSITVRSGDLLIEIVDDGKLVGVSAPSTGPSSTGQGLAGIADRAHWHGGRAYAEPGIAGGWRVFARIPMRGSSRGE